MTENDVKPVPKDFESMTHDESVEIGRKALTARNGLPPRRVDAPMVASSFTFPKK